MTWAETHRKRPEIAQAMLDHDVLPYIGDVPVAALRRSHFAELFARIVRRGKRVQANRVQALLRQAFAVAADQDETIEAIPVMPREAAGGEEKARETTLDDAELVKLWRGLDALSPTDKRPKIGRPLALALKLLLVTAQRRGELASAKWSDITETAAEVPDHKAKRAGAVKTVAFKVWSIPTNKTEAPHAIALSPLASKLLDELRGLVPKDSEELFPSKRTKEANAERDRSFTRAARTARKELGMKHWTPHDLRRTARTGMASIKVPDAIAERVLNHATGSRMEAVYNKHNYLLEMKSALDAWAARIEQLIAGPTK